MLKIGELLDGKYKILNEIGHGGMSVVYLALNERANKTWAVKEVRKNGANNNEVVTQGLVAETELLKKLNHPNLPSIVDVIDKNDSFIIVMDYIQGTSLQDRVDTYGAQKPEDVIKWARQLCDVLGYLHSRTPAIIYRDMKPANVMLKPDGNVVLIDFGTARETKIGNDRDTTWLGTRGYAAPEQFGGRGQTDARTDIYTLGATMYHLVTGYSPADTMFQINPISKYRPELAGSGLEQIILKCCRAMREERFQSCAELAYALDHPELYDTGEKKRKKRRWIGFLASAAVTLAGVVGMIGFSAAKNSLISQSYDTYLSRAETAADFISGKDDYMNAMSLQPDNEEVYEAVYDKIVYDGVFSNEEKQMLDSCCKSYPISGGNYTNLETLSRRNPEGYARFRYDLGYGYFFYFANGYSYAAQELADLQNTTALSDNQKKIANSLYTISNYYSEVSANKGTWLNEGNSWQDVWSVFNELIGVADEAIGKCGNTETAMALYRELMTQISTRTQDFVNAGITQSEMQQMLDTANAFMRSYGGAEENKNDATKELIRQTNNAIEAAGRAINSAYRSAELAG